MAELWEIAEQLKRLRRAVPPPTGIKFNPDDPEQMVDAAAVYVEALAKQKADDVAEGVRRFLAGECDPKLKLSLKHFPRPPELAAIVGQVRAERLVEDERKHRIERALQERREADEARKLSVHSEAERARAAELMHKFRTGITIETEHRPRTPITTPGLPSKNDDKRAKAEAERLFWADVNSKRGPKVPLMSEAALAMCLPVTRETAASVADRPLPPGMQQVAQAAPGIPEPVPAARSIEAPPMMTPEEQAAFEEVRAFLEAHQ